MVHICGYEEEDLKTTFIGKGIIKNFAGGMCHNKVIGGGYISFTFTETYKDDYLLCFSLNEENQVWDPLWAGNEAAFMWSIWHKAVAVNEWRVRIAPTSISKKYVFCLFNINESIKHKFWYCMQTRRA